MLRARYEGSWLSRRNDIASSLHSVCALLLLLRCYVRRCLGSITRGCRARAMVAGNRRCRLAGQPWAPTITQSPSPIWTTTPVGLPATSNSASDMHLPAATAASLSQNHWPGGVLLAGPPSPTVSRYRHERAIHGVPQFGLVGKRAENASVRAACVARRRFAVPSAVIQRSRGATMRRRGNRQSGWHAFGRRREQRHAQSKSG